MRTLLLTAAAVAAATMTATAGAHIPRADCNSHLPARAELRCATLNEKHARDVIGWARAQIALPALFDASQALRLRALIQGHSWLAQAMATRAAEARHRLQAAARPPHYAAWLCIHGGEGAWNSNTGNGFYGGLQFMQSTWSRNGGLRYATRADLATPLQQMWVAESAWRESGGSFSQWPNTARWCGLL